MKNQIELTQVPVIVHQFIKAGKEVLKRIEALDLKNQVVTAETIQYLKKLRAELNNEKAVIDKAVKAAFLPVTSVVDEAKLSYKENISTIYKDADNVLKDGIGSFELKLKDNIKADLEMYFKELCLSEKIDFVKFSQVGLNINLSTSDKKYKTACNEFIAKVQEDIKLIESEEFQAEIMAEYKTTLNASKAITDLRARKANEKAEREKILIKRTQERENMLRKWGMSYFDIAKAFTLAIDETISVKQSDIETFSDEDWQSKCIVLDLRIKEAQAKVSAPISSGVSTPTPKPEAKKPLESPKEVIKEEMFKAKFEVEASMSALKALGEYMKAQGIEYKNID